MDKKPLTQPDPELNEIKEKQKQFHLVMESLFEDEQDVRLTRYLVIGIAVATGLNTLLNIAIMATKK